MGAFLFVGRRGSVWPSPLRGEQDRKATENTDITSVLPSRKNVRIISRSLLLRRPVRALVVYRAMMYRGTSNFSLDFCGARSRSSVSSMTSVSSKLRALVTGGDLSRSTAAKSSTTARTFISSRWEFGVGGIWLAEEGSHRGDCVILCFGVMTVQWEEFATSDTRSAN